MKRKIFSKLLIGALLVASVSSFVSCKDYDDDIKDLQTQINSLSGAVDQKTATINQTITSMQQNLDQLNKLEATLTDKMNAGDVATLAAAKQAIADAQAALQAAIDKNADAIAQNAAGIATNKADIAAIVKVNSDQDEAIIKAQTAADQALAQIAELQASLADYAKKAELEAAKKDIEANAAEIAKIKQSIATINEKLAEIETIKANLTKVTSDLAETNKKLGTLSTTLEKAVADLAELTTAVNGQKTALEALKARVDAVDLTQIDADVKTLKEKIVPMEEQLAKLKGLEAATVNAKFEAIDGTIAELKAAHETFATKGEVANLTSEIKALKETTIPAVEAKINAVDAKYNTITAALAKALRSLVFMPYLYVDGIESIEYPYVVDTLKEIKGFTSWTRKRDFSKDALKIFNEDYEKTILEADFNKFPKLAPVRDWAPKTPLDVEFFGPSWPVEYHMNPSRATTVWGDIKGWNRRDAEIITRSDAAQYIKVTDTYADGTQLFKNENGVLTVGLQVEKPGLLANHANPTEWWSGRPGYLREDETTSKNYQFDDMIALQAKAGNDTIITSDYAMIYPEKVWPEAIVWHTYHSKIDFNKVGFDEQCPYDGVCHVWDTPKEALGAGNGCTVYPDIELYYDDKEGIVLQNLLGIHMIHTSKTLKGKGNPQLVKFTDPLFGQYGLSYEFQLVGYSIDGNKTVDSNYAIFKDADDKGVSKTGTIIARNVKEDGQTIDTESATSVDREPLVRVLVKRGTRVILDGYILIHITNKDPEKSSLVIDKYPQQTATFDLCNDENVFTTDWSQFSYYVLTQSLDNMTKEDFDAQYGTTADPGVPDRMFTTNPVYCANRTGVQSPDGYPLYHGYKASNVWSNDTWTDDYGYTHTVGHQIKEAAAIEGKVALVGADGMYRYDDIQLYKKSGNNFVKCTARDLPGYVRYYHNSVGTTNHRFEWVISADELEEYTHDKADKLPLELTRYFRYTGKAGAKYNYVYVEMKLKLDRATIAESGIKEKNTNYWFKYTGNDDGWDAVVWNPWYPRDWENTKNYSQNLTSTFIAVNGKNVVNFLNTTGLVKGPKANINASINETASGTALAKFYFTPYEFTIKAQDGTEYVITPRRATADEAWNAFVCKYNRWESDGTANVAHDKTWHNLHWSASDANAWYKAHKWGTPEHNAQVHKDCAVDYSKGVYTNNKLYAVKKANYGKAGVVYTEIATLNQNIDNGAMQLIWRTPDNDITKEVLNAVGYWDDVHSNILAELNTMVGVIAHNGCEVAINVPEYVKDESNLNAGTFYVSWQRPINVVNEANPMVDAKNNADYVWLVDFMKIFDWRGPEKGQMWGANQWLWAYYNIKGLTIDVTPSKMKTNMHQASEDTFVPMSQVTTQAKFSIVKIDETTTAEPYTINLDLSSYNAAERNTALLRYMGLAKYNAFETDADLQARKIAFGGGLKYENNGDNVTDFDVIVPVTVTYDWGRFVAEVKVHIHRTLGN